MNFGQILKSLRIKKGLSIKKLAPELGLNYTYISKIESSKVIPSEDVLNKISKYFHYSSDEIMLAAGKIPKDVQKILQENPIEAIKYLRKEFG